MRIYWRAGFTGQVSVTKPAQRHGQNTKTIHIHKNQTLNIQNKKFGGRKQNKRSTATKILNSEKK